MKKIYFLLIVLVVLLSACSGSSVSLEGEWALVSYGDASNPTSALPDVETSINFDADGKFGGNVGCNSFGAGYQVNGNQITFEPAFSTMMFCEATMDQETAILGIVSEQTLNFELRGNQLTLTSQDGSSVIVLEKK
ncbi:MAG: META domain-containing protein [Anaerolineales bacterium]|nr:META domain-containing protein [Anaerolineales bacterium]